MTDDQRPNPPTYDRTWPTSGAAIAANVTIVAPLPVPVSDNGGSLTTDTPQLPAALGAGGGVKIDGSGTPLPVTIPTPVPVTDNAGSLTVDGAVAVTNFPAVQPVNDNGGSLTVDGAVDVTDRAGRLVGVVDTELPAAAALADGVTNPTTPMVGAVVMGRNAGGTIDQVRAIGNDVDGVAATALGALKVADFPSVFSAQAALWDRMLADRGVVMVRHRANVNAAFGTGAANTALTVTLNAAGTGLFHYITRIRIIRVATAALAGGAILTITTTNFVGARQWRVGNNMIAGGTQLDVDEDWVYPLRSSVSNTATTIVCPAAGAAVSWDVVVDYFTSGELK
jgi:hypothetical protein